MAPQVAEDLVRQEHGPVQAYIRYEQTIVAAD